MQIRDHFKMRNFSLQHSDMEAFVTSKCKARTSYLAWRVFWALYHCSWLMGNIIMMCLSEEVSVAKWFIYLSNWMYLLLTLECVLEAIIVLDDWNRKSGTVQGLRLPWYIQMVWLLYTVSAVGSVMVSVWYWSLIHK
ncbi:unnamed protein product, partial [Candidula unifasciata]